MDTITLPGVSDTENATLNRLLKNLEDRSGRNLLRAAHYEGKHFPRHFGGIVPPQYYKLGIVLGWPAKAVDVLADRCNLDGFVWPDGDLDKLGFDAVADGNYLDAEVSSALISALIHGVSFMVTTKGGDGEPPALIHARDALSSTGTWNPRTRALDDFLSIHTRGEDGQPTSFALYLPGMTVSAVRGVAGWTIDRSEHNFDVPVDPLVYRPRVGRPYGQSRISRPVMSIHDSALRTLIRMEGHADVYSFPEMWLLGADESLFKNADGTQRAAWQVMLGRLKAIPDDDEAANPRADVKQFSAASPEPHIAQFAQYAKSFSGETGIPMADLGVDYANPTSAESFIASREPLIATAEGATDGFSPPLRRTIARALATAQGLDSVPAEWTTIAPKWRSPIYLSRAAQADAGGKQLAAVPWLAETEIGLELLGLSEQQIRRAMAERRRMGGSAALRAITEAAANGRPAIDPAAVKAQADAMGVLIRAGVSPEDAATRVGFDGVSFTGAVPTSLRLPSSEASDLEGP